MIPYLFSTKAKSEASGATNAGGSGSKLTKNQIESLNRRAKKVGEGLKELAKVASSTKNFDEKLQQDKQRIKDIDARVHFANSTHTLRQCSWILRSGSVFYATLC